MRFINWVSEFLEEVSWDERLALRVWREVISDWEVWRAALEEVREDWREVTLELWRREERWDFDRREVVSSRAFLKAASSVLNLSDSSSSFQ
mmetsp:Transcript_13497/g.24847  ORF Transcript_13497/g.24847 Transcript_13497/m.24847 type:complete len:92 (+) Transcript_13497:287-562(+)|eukprot:CAMPEP_0182518980 /NCGR_PEP_ID=MMETSP1321-20130603/44849_1 /TAXON_ID=91990 /ORGANISM="Bolidomonas sp., Strain RCC1657" /LENGTH=91 /DNA_ID=CAMNT_0024726925 /DNA_START=2224 /DNA_END=2499 /DNA_ORIENTATION=+